MSASETNRQKQEKKEKQFYSIIILFPSDLNTQFFQPLANLCILFRLIIPIMDPMEI